MADPNPFADLPPIGPAPKPNTATDSGATFGSSHQAAISQASQGAANPFGDLPPVVGQADTPPPTVTSIAKNYAAPVNTAIADVAGMPMDFGVAANQAAMDAGHWLNNKLTGQSDKTLSDLVTGNQPQGPQVYVPSWVPTSQHIKNWMGDLGIATKDTTKPQNLPERMAAEAGDMTSQLAALYAGGQTLLQSGIEDAYPVAGSVIRKLVNSLGAPGAIAEKAAPTATGRALQAAGDLAKFAWPVGKSALIAGGAGASGSLAQEFVPDAYKPYADIGGQVLGGGLVSAGLSATDAALMAGKGAWSNLVSPLTEAGQQKLAGQALRGAASDPGVLGANLEEGVTSPVPGVKPTIGMATNDPGLMQLERTTAQKNPGIYQERTAQNNLARVQAIQGLAPEGANPQAAKDFFKQQYDAADQATLAAENAAKAEAQARLNLVNGIGTPEQYGAAVRQQLLAQEEAAKSSASALWRAVDPSGTATVDVTPFKTASYQVRSAMPMVAKPMGGEEKAIFDAVDGLPQVTSFSDLQALDSRIGAEIRSIRGTPGGDLNSIRRLQILKNSIRDTMAGFVEGQGGHDAAAVQAGMMKPADTIFARLSQIREGLTGGTTAAAREIGSPEAGIPNDGANPLSTGTISPASGEALPGAGGAGVAPGTPGIPQAAPTADQALADRYRQAKAATLDLKQRFNQGPVSQVLQPGPRGAPFSVMDSAVGGKLFTPGPKGGETIAAYQKAGGDLSRLQDYITWNLRQAAVRNGVLDSDLYNGWANRYKTAIDALPDDIKAPFQNAATAQKALDDAQIARADFMKQQQNGELKAWLKDQDPQAAVGQTIGDATKFGQLVARARTASSPDVLDSLKQNTLDYMLGKTQGGVLGVGTDEGLLKGDALRKFVDTNRTSLSKLFTPEQMNVLDNVVSDIQRQNQVASASKLPFGSNTVQDLASAAKGEEPSVLGRMVAEALGSGVGAATAGAPGAAAGSWVAGLLSKLAPTGREAVQKLITQAVMDPEFGQLLLQKAGPAGTPTKLLLNRMLQRLAARTSAVGAVSGYDYTKKKAEGQ